MLRSRMSSPLGEHGVGLNEVGSGNPFVLGHALGNQGLNDLLLHERDEERGEVGSPGEALHSSMRAMAQRSLGTDLSDVRVHSDPDFVRARGRTDALALTVGSDIFLSAQVENSPNFVLAHELAHAAQQAGSTPGVGSRASPAQAGHHAGAEHEADDAATAILTGRRAEVSATPQRAAPFSPGHHQEATAEGLASTYSAQEIAAIYNSNWERDFSQGPPEIGNAVLAWKAVKASAAQSSSGKPSFMSALLFKAAIWRVIDMNATKGLSESLGGYKSWEHMDNPGEDASEDADQRWGVQSGELAGYIQDSRAYIKDQMTAALDLYRLHHGEEAVTGDIDNWAGGSRPEGYVSPDVKESDGGIVHAFPEGFNDPGAASREPLAEETSKLATAYGAEDKPQSLADEAIWAHVAQYLGRAMHAMEDFWAHSNWIELATGASGASTQGAITPDQLVTATFDMPDKTHAFGHKLVALADAFLGDFDLMLSIYGRTEESTRLSSTGAPGSSPLTSAYAFGPLAARSLTTYGEFADVVAAVNNMEEMIQSGEMSVEDFLCNRQYLEAVRNKGLAMIEHGEQASSPTGHAQLAKDQEEEGRNFALAAALAAEANERVFGPLRAIMDMGEAEAAHAGIIAQLSLVDRMIAPPGPTHPLWHVVHSGPTDFPLPSADMFMA